MRTIALNLEALRKAHMNRHIVIAVLLLVALTWLLYKLTVLMEPPFSDKRART